MKLYLKKPSAEEEQEWKNYIKEFRKIDINATPLGYYENIDYKDWLIKIENENKGLNLEEELAKWVALFCEVYYNIKRCNWLYVH